MEAFASKVYDLGHSFNEPDLPNRVSLLLLIFDLQVETCWFPPDNTRIYLETPYGEESVPFGILDPSSNGLLVDMEFSGDL